MCIITIAYKLKEEQPLLIVANRDEFYNRPAAAAAYWQENDDVFGGRDLEKMGSWLAVNKNGRFAAVTNYRDFTMRLDGDKSRGFIVNDFVLGMESSESFLQQIKSEGLLYGPMNVLVYDGETLWHYNNVTTIMQEMDPGLHCVSNATLNTPWPKAERMKALVANAIAENKTAEEMVTIGQDTEKPVDERLPSTGISLEMERELSSIFVLREGYGTRCTTILSMQKNADIEFIEQTYEEGERTGFIHEYLSSKYVKK